MQEFNDRASVILFGGKGERNMCYLDAKCGLPKGTCGRYRDAPQTIPLARFAAICEGTGKTDQEIVEAVKAYYRKGLR